MMPFDSQPNIWDKLYREYRAATLLQDRSAAFRQRTQIVRQARKLLGRADREQAWWVLEALEDPARKEFITSVLMSNVPRYFVEGMIQAGVREPDFWAKRRFIEPCVRSYSYRLVNERLMRHLEVENGVERVAAAKTLFWAAIREEHFWLTGFVIGERDLLPTREAQARYASWQPLRDRRTRLLVDIFLTTGEDEARWCIMEQLFLDLGVPDDVLRSLGRPALDLAEQSDNRYTRWRATRLRHGFASARAASEAALGTVPYFHGAAKAYRAFLHRCVRFLSDQGIDQFLDLDSSRFPYDTVHTAVHGMTPTTRIVYVCSDPVRAVTRRAIVRDQPHLSLVQADVLEPEAVLADAEVRRQIDFTRPLAVLMLSGLQFIRDDVQAQRVVQQYRDVLTSGSYLVLGHATPRLAMESRSETGRSRDAIAAFFAGMELSEPGIMDMEERRCAAEDDQRLWIAERGGMVCGLIRKP